MIYTTRSVIRALVLCAFLSFATSASQAGTIIKLNLGGIGPDIAMNGAGILGTESDGNAATTGDQNTAVEYTGFLDGIFSDINTSTASFTMSGLSIPAGAPGVPQVFGSLVIQNFTGGTFSLYSPANALLLSGSLTDSAMTGVIGPPGTGGLFTTSISNVTGGSLQSYIVGNSITLSMNMSNVNGGAGFGIGAGPVLLPFEADSSVNISGNQAPEPATAVLALLGAGVATVCGRRRR
jgi:PEP-CTERM motif